MEAIIGAIETPEALQPKVDEAANDAALIAVAARDLIARNASGGISRP